MKGVLVALAVIMLSLGIILGGVLAGAKLLGPIGILVGFFVAVVVVEFFTYSVL